jgi:DNA-binding CsgD family transcriptional regulator
MDRPQATTPGLLARFGVPPSAETVWRALMTNPRADIPELALATGVPRKEVEAALETLTAAHLVRLSSDPPGVVAIDPTLAVETHIARAERRIAEQVEELKTLRARVPELASDYARGRAAAGDLPGFEIVPANEVGHQLALAVERPIAVSRSIYHSATLTALLGARRTDSGMLARGVRLLSILATGMLDDPDMYAELEDRSREGELIRMLPDTPIRVLILDREMAVLPVHPTNLAFGALFVRAISVIDPLILLFDKLWSEAAPVFVAAQGAAAPTGRPARVLELMAIGTKDARIARTLRTGVRTVRRDVADLKASLGVASRAEVVAAAVRRGWL